MQLYEMGKIWPLIQERNSFQNEQYSIIVSQIIIGNNLIYLN